ncbi:MAG: DUF4434 domain-containing protein [Chthonomonadales bacterium]
MWISGTWMDFQHQNSHDGIYWNDQARAFTCAQWRTHVREMSQLDIDTIVLMSTSLDNKTFYPSKFMDRRWELNCSDPVEAVLSEADDLNIKMFVSAGFYGHTTEETSDDADYLEWHKRLTDELWSQYGRHRSFYGWYIPNEAEINGHFSEGIMNFVPRLSLHLRQLHPGLKILIAPYGTRNVIADSEYVDQLHNLNVDFIAYQDEVGVRKTHVEELPEIYGRLNHVHSQAGVTLWADMEIFDFEGDVYASGLIPTSLSRIEKQLAALSPYVEKILCYQMHGLMNPPGSQALCGHPESVDFFRGYNSMLHRAIF